MDKFLKSINIRRGLTAITVISLLVLSLSTILLNNTIFKDVFEQNVQQNLLPNQLAKVEARIRHQLSTPLELSKAITQNKFLIDWALDGEPSEDKQKVIDYLAYMQKANDALVVFWVSNISNEYLNQTGLLKTIDKTNDQWFYQFLATDAEFEIAFDYEEGSNQLTAFVNYKVSANGQDLAVAGLGYAVNQISNDILTNRIGDKGYVFVTNMEGDVIIHPNLSQLQQKQLSQLDGFARASNKLLQQSPNYVFDEVYHQGEDYYVASVGIPELKWKVVAMLPKAEPMSVINSAQVTTAIFNLVIAGGFIVLMVWLANRITSPIIDIGDRLLNMAERGGDLTQRLDDSRQDELGRLAKGFNALLKKINDLINEIKQTESVMESSFTHLVSMSDNVEAHVENQRTNSDSVATATNEMSHSIQEVSDLAGNTADKTIHAREMIDSTNTQVETTKKVMTDLHSSNDITQQKITDLADQTQMISSVVDTISAISEQTNLLALNAAIEAARAGEQGRGFAVVADEVRTLAARTQSSTQEINEVINKLQQQAQETVAAMAQNSSMTNQGLDQTSLAQEQLEALVIEINKVTEMNTHVATATNEQANVINELNVNVTTIADMASEIAALSVESKQVLTDLNTQKQHLASIVAQFKTQ